MADETITTTGIAAHGASRLPSAEIDTFNIELKDEEGFLGERAIYANLGELSHHATVRATHHDLKRAIRQRSLQ
jgi:hypothetical protein